MLFLKPGGSEVFFGGVGGGHDLVALADEGDGPVSIDLTAGTVQGLGGDTVRSIENAAGSFLSDTLMVEPETTCSPETTVLTCLMAEMAPTDARSVRLNSTASCREPLRGRLFSSA